MFVVNFDFSEQALPRKLLAINLPALLTELIAYPFQRIQNLLISTPKYITANQFTEAKLMMKLMREVEGFPKYLQGMRYSCDYTCTLMTAKFLIFDFLMSHTVSPTISHSEKWKVILNCYIANIFSIALSQIAFNYQTIASLLPINSANRPEDIKIKLQNYTKNNRLPIQGLKYTIPVCIINTTLELFTLNIAANFKHNQYSYVITDMLTAFCVFLITTAPNHYAIQRQVQICAGVKQKSIPFRRGLLGTAIRHNLKGLLLYGMYVEYFDWKTKKQVESAFIKRSSLKDEPQSYRK